MALPLYKWYIFQTNRNMFQSVKSREVELTCKTPLPTGLSNSEKDYAENTVYPPTNEDLKKMAQYIFKKKTIPTSLPISATNLDEKELPKVLVPDEMHCSSCLEHVPLSDPLLICHNSWNNWSIC